MPCDSVRVAALAPALHSISSAVSSSGRPEVRTSEEDRQIMKTIRWKTWLIAGFAVALAGLLFVSVRANKPPDVRAVSNQWAGSAHADRTAEAFVHWDQSDPVAVPKGCAKCHSEYGFMDFLGQDGSAPGVVDADAKVGSVLFCTTCHNEAAYGLTSVTFASGTEVTRLGREAVCMQCHQGTQSGVGVDKALAGKEEDTVDPAQRFVNVHYRMAAATQMGADAHVAYQYPGQTYVGRFLHTKNLSTCIACHDPHSLAVDPKTCSPCHANVVTTADLTGIRASSDIVDYDGDGNAKEPIAAEIAGLHAILYKAIQDYAVAVCGKPIVYSTDASPYFFIDTNADGQASADEAMSSNRYNAFTPRLVKATFNYQFVAKDPGNSAHNGKYTLQILYDSIRDLSIKVPVDMQGLVRP
jgi:hypothetical protein